MSLEGERKDVYAREDDAAMKAMDRQPKVGCFLHLFTSLTIFPIIINENTFFEKNQTLLGFLKCFK